MFGIVKELWICLFLIISLMSGIYYYFWSLNPTITLIEIGFVSGGFIIFLISVFGWKDFKALFIKQQSKPEVEHE